ncbi:MAG: methionyl-tRNA formyltransferase [Pyrinomonadaceae bacterium]
MKIVFMGTPQVAVPALERLKADGHEVVCVYTQPDRPAGRGNKISFSPVKAAALTHSLKVLQPEKVRTDEAREVFASHAAEVAVVVAYGRILPESFLSVYPHGAINAHFSLLPKYRGAAPVNWAVAHGEIETGVTTMRMDAGLDTGNILLQQRIRIKPNETAPELLTRLSLVGADLLSETLAKLPVIRDVVQDHASATLARMLSRGDGLIDWNMNAVKIANRVRAFDPFPTTYTFLGPMKLTLWAAESVGSEAPRAKVGEIVEVGRDMFAVSCGGRTTLRVTEVQPEGKRRMAVRDFLNGAKLIDGDFLGSR